MLFSKFKFVAFLSLYSIFFANAGFAANCSSSWLELRFSDGQIGCADDYKFFTIKRPSAPEGLTEQIIGKASFSVAITKNLKRCPLPRTEWSWGGNQRPTASIALNRCEQHIIGQALKKGIDPQMCECELIYDTSPNRPNVPLSKAEFMFKTRAWIGATHNSPTFKGQYTQDELESNAKFYADYLGSEMQTPVKAQSQVVESRPTTQAVTSLYIPEKNKNSEINSSAEPPPPIKNSTNLVGVNVNKQTTKSVKVLVIGNSSYSVSALANPINDAQAISKRLTDFGFRVDLVIDGNRKTLINALNKFQVDSSKYDVNILFYAGHGIQLNGINYIIPTDMLLASNGANVEFDAIPVNSVVEKYMQANTKIVFLDACRDNPLSRSLVATTRGSGTTVRGLAPMDLGGGTLISYSTKDGNVAMDGTGKNSPYTEALLDHVNERIDISLLLRKVRKSVMAKTNGKQVPWDYGSLMSDELILSNK